jgi:hypothetical protein
MSARPEILNEMDFRQKLEEMKSTDQKVDFLAWRIYDMQKEMALLNNKITCPPPDKKQTAFNVSGVAAFIVALIDAAIMFITRGSIK